MSYCIIKSIQIRDNNKVFINVASNNVRPHRYDWWECDSLSKILQEEGQEALDVAILAEYESGNFQGPKNKYTRARDVLYHMPEYKSFNWRAPWGEEYDRVCGQRQSNRTRYEELLRKALKTQLPQDKFVLRKKIPLGTAYLRKLTRRCAFWTQNIAEAKIFRYAEDAEGIKEYFKNAENWEAVKLETKVDKRRAVNG